MFNAEVLIRESLVTGTTIVFKRYITPAFYAVMGEVAVAAHLERYAKLQANRRRFPTRFWSLVTFQQQDKSEGPWAVKTGWLTYERKDVQD